MNRFDVAEAMWTIGILNHNELPLIAANGLIDGLDSQSLRILAGLEINDYNDAESLFQKSLKELGRRTISKEEALRIYIRFITNKIINKEITPEAGARQIWDVSIKAKIPNLHEPDPFIYAVSELEERPRDKEFFSNEIIEEARRWVA